MEGAGADLAGLRSFLQQQSGVAQFAQQIEEGLGCESVSDLQHVEVEDLTQLGVKLVPARKFAAAVKRRLQELADSSSCAASAATVAQQPAPRKDPGSARLCRRLHSPQRPEAASDLKDVAAAVKRKLQKTPLAGRGSRAAPAAASPQLSRSRQRPESARGPRDAAAASTAASAQEAVTTKPGCAARKAAKQSGVPNVRWDCRQHYWRVGWSENGKTQGKMFSVRSYMLLGGKSYEEANAEALRDAVAFRTAMAREGKLKKARAGTQSQTTGIRWRADAKAWYVNVRVRGRQLHGGSFRPKDGSPEEVERARLAAVRRRQQLVREHSHLKSAAAVDAAHMEKKESGVASLVGMQHRGDLERQGAAER